MEQNAQRVLNHPSQKISRLLHIAKTKLREEKKAEVNRLLPFIPENAVIFDIGAHFGQYAKIFAGLHNRSCQIYCFEPVDYTRSILKKVVSEHKNLQIFPFGFSNEAQTLKINIPLKKSGKIGPGLAHLGPEKNRDYISQEITLKTIDDFVTEQKIDRLDFIKIDIEGAELLAFQGGSKSFDQFKPTVISEIEQSHMDRMGLQANDLFKFFTDKGYTAQKITKSGLSQSIEHFNGDGDYIFIYQSISKD